ncbi:MAG: FlgD immunoglobulin-like domain containing protein, partial [Candidatus Poribacteria bacterium]
RGEIRASHLRLNGSRVNARFAYPFAVRPFQNSLMANYPNPFNPETWIPFELKADSDVTIRIYGLDGRAVRTLDLGLLTTGEYVGRDDAAYWDGKNAHGERVASGVYIYELSAGEYHAMRRMVIMK